MQIKINSKTFFVFDLDDTLFQEIDFLKSAYSHISSKISPTDHHDIYNQMLQRYHNKENVFEWVISRYRQAAPDLSIQWLLKEYREHVPSIQLSEANIAFFQNL